MRDYPFNFNQLKDFSESVPYQKLSTEYKELYQSLKEQESKLNFPAIKNDVGSFINFLFFWHRPKTIFEFGSGYGQSAFWYLLNQDQIEKITLTEKRDDLQTVFNSLNWPNDWIKKIDYNQADAFEVFEAQEGSFDFILIDGVKADYLKFLELCYPKLNKGALVLIDNSYWRGSFLDEEIVTKKKTAANIKKLHEYIQESVQFQSIFIPFEDGVSLLRKID